MLAGNKVSNVDVVYTPWANLKKTPGMDVGQVGFHSGKAVRADLGFSWASFGVKRQTNAASSLSFHGFFAFELE